MTRESHPNLIYKNLEGYAMRQSETLLTLLVTAPPHLVCLTPLRLSTAPPFTNFFLYFSLRTIRSDLYSTSFLFDIPSCLNFDVSVILFLHFSVGRGFIFSLLFPWNNVNGHFNHQLWLRQVRCLD